MTKLNDEDLHALQHEVQRLLGRCLLRLQQYERLIKAMLAHHSLSGPIDDLERAKAAKIDETARKTLGTLVGDLLGSYVVADEIDPPEETTNQSPAGVNWVAMQTWISLPNAQFGRVKSELRETVLLRNNLVHHFIDQHEIFSSDGCRDAQDTLIIAYNRIDQHLGQLREWAEDTKKTRQALSDFLQSEQFEDVFSRDRPPMEKLFGTPRAERVPCEKHSVRWLSMVEHLWIGLADGSPSGTLGNYLLSTAAAVGGKLCII